MIDGSQRVEFRGVVVLDHAGLVLRCQINDKIVGVPPLRMLPGSTLRWAGDVGSLVLPRDVAENLGLISRA
jgi:hypothetical protein